MFSKMVDYFLKESEEEQYNIVSHIKKLIGIVGIEYPYYVDVSNYNKFLHKEYSRTSYWLYEIWDYKISFDVKRIVWINHDVFHVKYMKIYTWEEGAYERIHESHNDEWLIRAIYDYISEKESEKEEEEKRIKAEKIKLLIIEDNKKYINQSRFDEFDYVLEKRRRLDEITKEAQAIAAEFSLVK